MPSVLVVDDEDQIRSVVSRLLAHDGHRVFTVGSGREAIRKLQEDRYDVLMLDVRLPDESSSETMTEIRDRAPHLPIVVMSGQLGFDDRSVSSLIEGCGACVRLAKPFSLEELRCALSEALA